MFSSYTWSSFFSFIGLMVFMYFFIIGFAYYKYDIAHFLFSKPTQLQGETDAPVRKSDLLPIVHELVSELGLIIRQASENNPVIPELKFALKQRIKDFLILETTEYKGKINLYIAEELEIHGIDGILPEDIDHLWNYP